MRLWQCHQPMQCFGKGCSPVACSQHRTHQTRAATSRAACAGGQGEPIVLPNVPGVPVYLFGVDHLASQSHAAEFILHERPAAVVVETAVDEEHGSRTGNAISLNDPSMNTQNPYAGLGLHLAAMSLDRAMALCRDLAARQMPPEQLIYAAALASGSRLVYGDVPKLDSIRRLWEQASLQELDVHFSRQAAANFRSLLDEGAVVVPDTPDSNRAFQILFHDREAAFCRTMRACSQQLSPQLPQSLQSAQNDFHSTLADSELTAASPSRGADPSDWGSSPLVGSTGDQGRPAASKAGAELTGSVVGIVGDDHVEGIQQAWANARLSSSDLDLVTPPAASRAQTLSSIKQPLAAVKQTRNGEAAVRAHGGAAGHHQAQGSPENAGVKRALLERMLGLAIPENLALTLCRQALEPLADADLDAYLCCYELYGSSRMLLACLQPSELKQVCGAWNCDIWSVLDPVRRLQPSLGGPGFDWDVVYELRCLNFEL